MALTGHEFVPGVRQSRPPRAARHRRAGVDGRVFGQWAEACHVQLEPGGYPFICIYTDQLERLQNDQSECTILTNRKILLDQSELWRLNPSFA